MTKSETAVKPGAHPCRAADPARPADQRRRRRALNRLIGSASCRDVDPFLLLDEFRSDDASDYIAGFPEHPHRGFETVTYMLAGRMRHGDNKGHTGRLDAGSVQWMTAGRGILHSEMPEQENGLMWGFQLWVNLPAKDKMTAPRYQEIPPERIPVAELAGGIRAKVVAGKLDGVEGPIGGIATDPNFFDFTLPKGAPARRCRCRPAIAPSSIPSRATSPSASRRSRSPAAASRCSATASGSSWRRRRGRRALCWSPAVRSMSRWRATAPSS